MDATRDFLRKWARANPNSGFNGDLIGLADIAADETLAPLNDLIEEHKRLQDNEEVLRAELTAAMSQHSYWYRRCQFAEAALEELTDAACAVDTTAPTYAQIDSLHACVNQASVVLAEKRKADEATSRREELPNYEDFIRDRRQAKVWAWCERTFGSTPELLERLRTPEERAKRFLEEAIELYQAVMVSDGRSPLASNAAGVAHRLVDTVFSRPPGEPYKEAGAVMITLLGLAQVLGFSVVKAEKDEFSRILAKPREEFQARWEEKRHVGV